MLGPISASMHVHEIVVTVHIAATLAATRCWAAITLDTRDQVLIVAIRQHNDTFHVVSPNH